jgi:hypothetical protein
MGTNLGLHRRDQQAGRGDSDPGWYISRLQRSLPRRLSMIALQPQAKVGAEVRFGGTLAEPGAKDVLKKSDFAAP